LSWYHSATIAFFPDETHRSIRRTFVSPFDESIHRQFCGYCGTQLSQWSDADTTEESFISLTLGSLAGRSLEVLEELGLFGGESEEEGESESEGRNPLSGESGRPAERAVQSVSGSGSQPVGLFHRTRGVQHRGAPWFEELVQDSRLGTLRRQKGGHVSADGSTSVEWEVVEWTSESADEEGRLTPGKRKHGEIAAEGADHMDTRT
jgi:hypothetical protein